MDSAPILETTPPNDMKFKVANFHLHHKITAVPA